ncbi:MAG: hypothetical protein KAW12_16335 [Candidatus Aminicenantes bacterium]|nr:hypothetical protein [Candidatus Aminicenantes bacterium]
MKERKHSFLILFFFVISTILGSQLVFPASDFDWVKIETPASPEPPRSYIQTVYDPINEKIVLFGGSPYNDVGLNDLWEYNGSTWEQRFPLNSPSTRYAYNMVYDSNRNVIVLFGGEDWPTLYGDTWEYDGNTWYKVNTAHSPISRAHFALAYDSKRNVVVLFGGWHWYVDQGDTWEYDGTDWIQRSPANSPCERQQVTMVYDENREVVVLFGGTRQYAGQGGPFNDTWEWDGTNWTEIQPQQNPGARYYHQMTYNSDNNKVILHGGNSLSGIKVDTWEYDGVDWTKLNPETTPGKRTGFSFSYYPKNKSIVLFGGHIPGHGWGNDTWELIQTVHEIEAIIDIKPETLNIKSKGKRLTTYIELPGGYAVENIDLSSVAIVEVKGTQLVDPIYAESRPTSIGDYDGDGIADLMIKFSRRQLVKLKRLHLGLGLNKDIDIKISGKLNDDTKFSGTDSIRLIKK